MTHRFRATIMTLTLAASALLAQGAAAVSCFGTNGGGTGGTCDDYASQQACVDTICQLSAGQVTDPNCDPNTESCGTVDEGCSCTCYPDFKSCEAVRAPAAGTFKPINLTNPLGTSDVRELAARGILAITGIAGSVALLMFVWGGFLWITSAGSAEKAKKAKEIFVNAIYGLVLIFGSYALINALLNAFAGVAS